MKSSGKWSPITFLTKLVLYYYMHFMKSLEINHLTYFLRRASFDWNHFSIHKLKRFASLSSWPFSGYYWPSFSLPCHQTSYLIGRYALQEVLGLRSYLKYRCGSCRKNCSFLFIDFLKFIYVRLIIVERYACYESRLKEHFKAYPWCLWNHFRRQFSLYRRLLGPCLEFCDLIWIVTRAYEFYFWLQTFLSFLHAYRWMSLSSDSSLCFQQSN